MSFVVLSFEIVPFIILEYPCHFIHHPSSIAHLRILMTAQGSRRDGTIGGIEGTTTEYLPTYLEGVSNKFSY